MTETARFLDRVLAEKIRQQFGTPIYVYSEKLLREAAEKVLELPAPFGFTARYAMKANPNRTILKLFDGMGLHIDASSGYEAERAMAAGIHGEKIQLTAQELPHNLKELVEAGVSYTACSLHQIEAYGKLFPGTALAVRINPGVSGAGFHSKVAVAGEEAGFAIWHEVIPEAKKMLEKYRLTVKKVHTHIGSGTDPEEWQRVAEPCAALLDHFPEATQLSLGGGFKVAYMQGEKTADFVAIGERVAGILRAFFERTGRKIHLEIEPGRFLVAAAGSLLTSVQDLTSTSRYHFLKLDTGMTEILRPTMYGAQHPIVVLNDSAEMEKYLVVGHCCESGDLLTPDPAVHDKEKPRLMAKAEIGDLVAIEVAGAYCSSMSAINYNSFPQAAEVLVQENGAVKLIRRRQTMEQILENEI
jgi:diaminopimelate decarboxylase